MTVSREMEAGLQDVLDDRGPPVGLLHRRLHRNVVLRPVV